MIHVPCLFFADKNKYYANELICIFEYRMKGQYLSFKLVPNLSFYVEHRL